MTGNERIDDSIARWLEETAPSAMPERVLAATFDRTRRLRQGPARWAFLGSMQRLRVLPALGGTAVILVAAVLVLNLSRMLGPAATPSPSATAEPSAATPSLEPGAVRIECGNSAGSWTYAISAAAAGSRPLARSAIEVLGCSSDGTRVLFQRDKENLFILRAGGSVTQVTDQLTGIAQLVGSARPAGATISPDGSRVIFAGIAVPRDGWRSCHDGALFGVNADGGPTDLLWASRVPQNGIVDYPTFSPDGTLVAFADGYCDSTYGLWVMNADGTNPHQVVPTNTGPLGATHVHGVGWTADGARLAILTDDGVYSVAADGSDFRKETGARAYCWQGLAC